MHRSVSLLLIAIITGLSQSAASAAEIWTYFFIPDGSRPYLQSCGDLVPCQIGGAVGRGIRADMAGSFSLLLDWQTGDGRLVSLDDRLVNIAAIQDTTGEVLSPATPSYMDHGLYTPWAAPTFVPGTFSEISSGNWQLVSNGWSPLAGGGFFVGTPYDITFSLTHATLSLDFFYADDANSMHVFNAPAVLGDAAVAGDFNGDSQVDTSDYVAWRKSGGEELHYHLWRTLFNTTAFSGSGQAAPEPSAILLVGLAVVCMSVRRTVRPRVAV
jgi:hypothetical protein